MCVFDSLFGTGTTPPHQRARVLSVVPLLPVFVHPAQKHERHRAYRTFCRCPFSNRNVFPPQEHVTMIPAAGVSPHIVSAGVFKFQLAHFCAPLGPWPPVPVNKIAHKQFHCCSGSGLLFICEVSTTTEWMKDQTTAGSSVARRRQRFNRNGDSFTG